MVKFMEIEKVDKACIRGALELNGFANISAFSESRENLLFSTTRAGRLSCLF